MQFINSLMVRAFNLFNKEDGQDGFEYLLVVGGVSVAIVVAIVAGVPSLMPAVIKGTCEKIATVVSTVTC